MKRTSSLRITSVALLAMLTPFLFTACAELQDLRQIKEVQDRRITDLERLLEKKTLEQDTLQKQNRESERQAQTLSDNTNQLTRQLDETKQQLNQANEQLKALGGQLQTKDLSLSQTAANLEQQSKQAQSLNEQVTKTQTDLGQANNLLKQKDAELAKLKETLAEASKQAQASEQAQKDLEAQLAEAKSASEKATGEKELTLAALQKENEDLKTKAKSSGSGDGGGASNVDFDEASSLLQQSLKPIVDAQMASVAKDNRGVVVRLSSDYLFQQDTMELDPQVDPTLDQIASILNRYPNAYVEVQGHTDSQTIKNLPFSDNWALASARAQKVVRYLAEHTSLKSSRLKSSSASEYRPIKDGSGKMNRRVEIVLTNQP